MPFKKGETPEGAIPFEKGESGNPAGRPVGSMSFKAIAEKLLDGLITIEQAGEKRKISRKEKAILNIINDAINDEDPSVRLRALSFLMDRTEGKVTDKTEITGKDGKELPAAIITVRIPSEPPKEDGE